MLTLRRKCMLLLFGTITCFTPFGNNKVALFVNFASPQSRICIESPKTNKGKEFIVTVPPSPAPAYTTLQMYIAAEYETNVTLVSEALQMSVSAVIQRKSVKVIGLDAESISQSDAGPQTKYIHVIADQLVAVYLSAFTGSVGSTYTVYPVTSLSTRYMVGSYLPDSGSHIIVTAIYNDTDVNLTSVQGELTNFTLDAYDSYNMKTYSDVSGTMVTASKPVSVVYGAICTRIPSDAVSKSTVWYGDGTFPVHFYQLYTIHGIVLGQLLPLVFCLITKKSKSTYELLVETFKDVACEKDIEIKVETIRADFEEADIKSMYCDSMVTSPLPVESWGTEFIVPPLLPRKGYIIRIFAEELTQVQYHNMTNSSTVNVTRTEPLTLTLGNKPLVIQASKPVYVVQFGLSFDYDNYDGGAFETSVQSLTHFSSEYVFPAPLENFDNTLVITIEKQHRRALQLDGTSLLNDYVISVPSPLNDYEIILVHVSGVNHSLSHPVAGVTFGAMVFGQFRMTGYGFTLGMTLPRPPYTCYNAGSCGSNSQCICPSGYSGMFCEKVTQVSSVTPHPKRGPVCFDCSNVIQMASCLNIKYCQENEICSIEEYKNSQKQNVYNVGCKDTQLCNSDKTSSSSLFPRIICQSCCSQDFCNRNCTQEATGPPIIVG